MPPASSQQRPSPQAQSNELTNNNVLIITGGFIMALPLSASGSTQPVRLIIGDQTELLQQTGLCVFAVDGSVLVTTGESGFPAAVRMFPGQANGNIPPTFSLQGPHTQLSNPWGVLILQLPDFSPPPELRLWVVNTADGITTPGYITSYAATGGDQQPINQIGGASTRINSPMNLAVGTALVSGSFASIYVTQRLSPQILAFPVEASGDVAPARLLDGPQTGLTDVWGRVAFDGLGNLYVCDRGDGNPGVLVFADGTSGDVAPSGIIRGSQTQLQELHDIAVSSTDEIYVLSRDPQTGWVRVLVFAAGATGNVSPVRVIEPPVQGFTVYSMCIYEAPAS
jgi:hypothetical protein